MLGIYFDYLRKPDAYDLDAEAEALVNVIFRCVS